MNKNLIIKSAIFLVVASLVYSVFWFFKVGQIEKQVSNFISENNSYISSGEISLSGFPFSQKITIKDLKLTIPNPALNKNQIVIKTLEARAKIFSSNFSVTFSEGANIQDLEGNSASIEFSKDPEIKISINDGRISKFIYQDSGYRILDVQKNVTYSATSTLVSVDSTIGSDEKITTKITANIKDIEGFDLVSVYKNAFEKKVIEGIKTGEIALNNNSSSSIPPIDALPGTDASNKPSESAPVSQPEPVIDQAQKPASELDLQPTNLDLEASKSNQPSAETAQKPEEIAVAVSSDIVKSNFVIDLDYILTPIKNEDPSSKEVASKDPTQVQEIPLQYSKTFKVNSLEFFNPLYKITVNGEMNFYVDDSMPSGSLAIKVEKINSLISYISSSLTKMIEPKQPSESSAPKPTDLATNEPDKSLEQPNSNNSSDNAAPISAVANSMEDPYQAFLKKISINFSQVAKELAAKNAVSKEEIAEFDIRREKNLEFLINETSTREILGKF